VVSEALPGRTIAMLGAAAAGSSATMRLADPLVPQVAQEFAVTAGDAAVIATAFTLAYGLCQPLWGALGDRFGKFRLVALMTLVSALSVGAAALAGTLAALGAARLAAGVTCAAIVPLCMAFIGDHVPYDSRQAVLARFMGATILGMIAGQTLGGVLGDLLGWRAAFLVVGGWFLLIGGLLLMELHSRRLPPPQLSSSLSPAAVIRGYGLLLRRRWARIVLATVFIEGFLFFGAFTFVGAHLRLAFGLDYTIVGLLLGLMGVGGLIYALAVDRLVGTLGERGLAIGGAITLALAFVVVAVGPLPLVAAGIVLLGLGMFMLHNTLQTNATQMAPEARGLAVSTFANALFLGQAGGIWLAGSVVDRVGFVPVFVAAGLVLLLLGGQFARLLGQRPAE